MNYPVWDVALGAGACSWRSSSAEWPYPFAAVKGQAPRPAVER